MSRLQEDNARAAALSVHMDRSMLRLAGFMRDELIHLLAVAESDLPAAYPPVLTMAKTGICESELLALRREDLDFSRRIL